MNLPKPATEVRIIPHLATKLESYTTTKFKLYIKQYILSEFDPTPIGHSLFADVIASKLETMMASFSTYQLANLSGSSIYSQAPSMPGLIDNYYLYPPVISNGTNAVTLGTLKAFPIYIPQFCVVTEIGVSVSAEGSGSSLRLGIYNNSGTTGQPGYLLEDFGTVSTTSGGTNVGITGVWKVLRPGWYWPAAVQQGATATLRTITTLGYPTLMDVATHAANAGVIGYSSPISYSSGALPSYFGQAFVPNGMETNNVPMIYLRLRSIGT